MPYRPAAPPAALGAPAPMYRPQPGAAARQVAGQPPRRLAGAPPHALYRPQASVGPAAAGGGVPGQPRPGGAPPPVFRPSQPASYSQQHSAGTSAAARGAAAHQRQCTGPSLSRRSMARSLALVPVLRRRRTGLSQQQAAVRPAPVYRPQQAAAATAGRAAAGVPASSSSSSGRRPAAAI